MRSLRYGLVLAVLALATLSCFVVVVRQGFSGFGVLATLGAFLCVALFFSYGLTMRGKHSPIAR